MAPLPDRILRIRRRVPARAWHTPWEYQAKLREVEHRPMTESRPIEPNEDPVCGMTVDIESARARGLALSHDGREYVFCGKGCYLEFRDDPATFLDAEYRPSM
jgi:YHS domain-containing protein